MESWMHKKTLVAGSSVAGFIFPQTPTYESIVVSVVPEKMKPSLTESKSKTKSKESINDLILKYVSKKMVETYQTCRIQKKQVAWTWPIIEMYMTQFINQFYDEASTSTPKPPATKKTKKEMAFKIRVSSSAPRGAKTVSVEGANEIQASGANENSNEMYVVISFPITDEILQTMYRYLLDYAQVKQVLKVVRHEGTKFKESILRNVLEQHERQNAGSEARQQGVQSQRQNAGSEARQQGANSSDIETPKLVQSSKKIPPLATTEPHPAVTRSAPPMSELQVPRLIEALSRPLKYSEAIAIQPQNKNCGASFMSEAVEVKFEAKLKPAYTSTRVPKETYLSTVRVKHMRANTEFESMLVMPIVKSIKDHPFYLFLHRELQQCREQMYRSSHPDAPLVRPNLTVGIKRKTMSCES
jgi:hypothetical protein